MFCLRVPKITRFATKTMTGFKPGHCGVPDQFMHRTSLWVQSGTWKFSSGISVRGHKREALSTGWGGQLVPLEHWDKALTLTKHFQTVFTRESSLSETVPQSRIGIAKIEYVQITCTDVRRWNSWAWWSARPSGRPQLRKVIVLINI